MIRRIPMVNGCTGYVADSRNEAYSDLPLQFIRGDVINVTPDFKGIVSNVGVFTVVNPTKELVGKFWTRLYVCRVGSQILVKTELQLLPLNPEKALDAIWINALNDIDKIHNDK